MDSTDLTIDQVRVFTCPDGACGNVLGVVRDGAAIPEQRDRQELARRLGHSETVFVDDPGRGALEIYTPSVRLPFAGYPLIGAAWLLGLDRITLDVADIPVRRDGELTWITARPDWALPRTLRQYRTPDEVEALAVPEPGEWTYAWAWQDESAGRIRARGFPGRGDGIQEDEATGAAALQLAGQLGRALTVTQGAGSQLFTRPASDGLIALGGRVRLD
ncbi:PhzF family phenazine biosynthesis protein [Kitasatospora acidiphila]|uniref:PhzF family phenazine biosynthesis protein n=1 Tax=Kitasatospora acidiphila TaxID=2567942 RepID=A0A540VWX1_9ACTN|nr:PhzF family phenazine biosynthesis protein [Kitasatospora acidiphila]TQF01207.1 PhzF family phenazine biosynthesis protein [Kitasatospora acidiphila]